MPADNADAALPTDREVSCVDDERFVNTYRDQWPRVEQHLSRHLPVDVATDLASETFTAAWKSRDTYDPERGTEAQWIFGIARNVRAAHMRAAARASAAVAGASPGWTDGEETQAVDRVDAALLIGAAAIAIGSLDPDDLQVLIPVIVAALGGLELTRRTNAQHLRLHRIREKLRASLL